MKSFTPLGNNILVKRVKPKVTEETKGGIIIPQDAQPMSAVEEVVLVAISPEIHLNDTTEPQAKPGDKCLVHRGLNSIPIEVKGVEHLIISYVNLIGVVG